jgi:hypothetical protein
MIDILISIAFYAILGFVGIFLFKRIEFTKNFLNNRNIIIFLSIFYLIVGIILSKLDGSNNLSFDIGFAIGNYLACFLGAVIATFLVMRFKFSFKNELFYYSLSGSIIFRTILFIFNI